MYSNNAIDYSKLSFLENEVKVSKKENNTKAKTVFPKKINKRKALFSASVVFACLFAMVYMSVQVSVLNNKLSSLKKEVTVLESSNQVARLELDKNLDLAKIENMAMNSLGMIRPEKYQMVYISLEGKDYTEKVNTKGEKGGVVASIFGAKR